MLHRNLQKRLKGEINLEGENRASPSYQEEFFDEKEGEAIVEEITSLESANVVLEEIMAAKINLEDAGVAEETITSALAPVVISALESVDTTVAEEATVQLEDDKSSFWQKTKDTVKKIWDAIVARITAFVKWIGSFFVKKEKAIKEETKAIVVLEKEIEKGEITEASTEALDLLKEKGNTKAEDNAKEEVKEPEGKKSIKLPRSHKVEMVPKYTLNRDVSVNEFRKAVKTCDSSVREYLTYLDELTKKYRTIFKEMAALKTASDVSSFIENCSKKNIYEDKENIIKELNEELVVIDKASLIANYSKDVETVDRDYILSILKGAKEINSAIPTMISLARKSFSSFEEFKDFNKNIENVPDEAFDALHSRKIISKATGASNTSMLTAINLTAQSIAAGYTRSRITYLSNTPKCAIELTRQWIKEAKKQLAEV